MNTPSDFFRIAVAAAREAANIHLSYFEKGVIAATKSVYYDQVTIADTEAEDRIVAIIKKRFPEHDIVAEEKTYARMESEYVWIIDPLDGTNNFAHGIPIFSVSIALAYKGEVVLGVVLDPTRNELYYAEKGKGAFRNDMKISVTNATGLEQSILITGFYYDRGEKMIRTLENIKSFFLKGIIGIRRFGSAAIDLCWVAAGRADGFFEFELKPWDFCAGKFIVEEAGGIVTDNKGGPVRTETSYIVASNGKIHEYMLSVVG